MFTVCQKRSDNMTAELPSSLRKLDHRKMMIEKAEGAYTNNGDVLDVVLEARWLGFGILFSHFGYVRLGESSGLYQALRKFEDIS